MTREALLALAAPLLDTLATLNADEPASSVAALSSVDTTAFEAALREAHNEGWVTPRESGGVRFGRLTKAGADSAGFSIDIVVMDGAAPGAHTHPTGEFDLLFTLEGSPRFDGHDGRWLVYPPGSRHVPTVTGGGMLIAYFLPEGAIRFDG